MLYGNVEGKEFLVTGEGKTEVLLLGIQGPISVFKYE